MAVNIFWACVLIALLGVFWKDLKQAAENLGNHFGGPPGPMGPLPSSDTHLLLKRRLKKPTSL